MKSSDSSRRYLVRCVALASFVVAPSLQFGCSSGDSVVTNTEEQAKGNGNKFKVISKLGTKEVLDKTAGKTKKK